MRRERCVFWNTLLILKLSFTKSPVENYFVILRILKIWGGYSKYSKDVSKSKLMFHHNLRANAREIPDSEKVNLRVAGGSRPRAVPFIKQHLTNHN